MKKILILSSLVLVVIFGIPSSTAKADFSVTHSASYRSTSAGYPLFGLQATWNLSLFVYSTIAWANNISYSLTYNARTEVASDGTILNDGDSVNVGSRLIFSYDASEFLPGRTSNLIWSGWICANQGAGLCDVSRAVTGNSGVWGNNSSICDGPEYLFRNTLAGITTRFYSAATAIPPSISFDPSPAISSGALKDCVYGSNSMTCTVAKDGEIKVNVKFGATSIYQKVSGREGGFACHNQFFFETGAPGIKFSIPVPEKTIEINLIAVNQLPPAGYIIPPPTITGPATGTPGRPYAFSAQSAVPTGGPTGRNYRYGFDWNRDRIVDFWTARVPDGTAGSATSTWAMVGSKVFGVIAEDNDFNRSLPSYHSINISNDGGVCVPSEFWTPCSKPCGGGTQNKLNSCTLEILDQKSCNTKACGTIIREVPP